MKKYALLNLASVLLVIAVNYSSQVLRLNNTTIGEISGKYSNLFTPASYAFSIWGIIFLGLLAYGIFQVRRAFFSDKKSAFIAQTGYWFVVANLLNATWVFACVYDYIGLSVLIMLGILISLLKIILNTNMEREKVSRTTLAFVWWPIGLYSGWITVATIANIAMYLTKLGWNGSFLSETNWTVTMLIIAVVLNIIVLRKRNMSAFVGVGVWALFAIYSRHKASSEAIAYTALAGSILLLVTLLVHNIQNSKVASRSKLKS
ncbi:tryptophan-rich sensory protein [Maribacter sp. R77961]|jgi:hypothetical protein|uniref:tryptophan-rich sensory protein n=1 Tax=Maribacter sp. R77961 TaxID=3093871 RepID=UPI0037C6A8E7